MIGNITRRGKSSWRLKFDLGPDPVTGKRKIAYKTVRGSKREAQTALALAIAEHESGEWIEPSALTVQAYLEKWLTDHSKVTVSAKTYERYADLVDHHLIPRLGAHRLQRLTPLHIQGAYADMLANGRRDGKGGLSARTVHHAHRVLFAALRQAVRWQLLSRNSAEGVTAPKPDKPEIPILDNAGMGELLKAALGTRLYLPTLLAVTTGLRRGEVLGLRWKDVALETHLLTVAQKLEETKAGLAFRVPKTERSRRTVTLPAITVEALRQHKKAQAEDRLRLGLGKDDLGLLFTRIDGTPMRPRQLSQEFARLAKSAGLKVSYHGLRHSHLTALMASGVNPKVICERAGRASVATTLDLYGHVMPGMQEKVAQGVDAAIRTALEH